MPRLNPDLFDLHRRHAAALRRAAIQATAGRVLRGLHRLLTRLTAPSIAQNATTVSKPH